MYLGIYQRQDSAGARSQPAPSPDTTSRRDGRIAAAGLLALIMVLPLTGSMVSAQNAEGLVDERATEAESPDFGSLPWSDQQEHLGDLPARRLTHARELLHLLSIDDSQLAGFVDGVPLGVQDEERVTRVLYNMPRFPLNALQRWAESIDKLPELLADPDEHRADTLLIRGRTTHIERVEVLPEAVERLEFAGYFRVRVALPESPHAAILCCRDIPAAWGAGQVLGEPIVAYGVFLKLGARREEGADFVFATPQIGWLPTEPDAQTGVTPDLVQLASLGMDISLFDDIRPLNRKPIAQADRECFYQLLATLGRADAGAIRPRAQPTVDLAPLLQQPETQHGRLMIVRGTARRAMKIRVDDADIHERFGIDHYFQVDVFIPLDDQVVRLGSQQDAAGPTFTNSYPVTVCVLRLPAGLPEGADIREEVSIPAACFKLWAYKSRFVSSFDPDQLQVSPMFIGVEPQVIELDTSRNPYVGWSVAGLFVAVLAGAWIALWRSSRNDAKFKRSVLARHYDVQPGNSLNEAKIDESSAPDFSNWKPRD